jgi:hypothetical protein
VEAARQETHSREKLSKGAPVEETLLYFRMETTRRALFRSERMSLLFTSRAPEPVSESDRVADAQENNPESAAEPVWQSDAPAGDSEPRTKTTDDIAVEQRLPPESHESTSLVGDVLQEVPSVATTDEIAARDSREAIAAIETLTQISDVILTRLDRQDSSADVNAPADWTNPAAAAVSAEPEINLKPKRRPIHLKSMTLEIGRQ